MNKPEHEQQSNGHKCNAQRTAANEREQEIKHAQRQTLWHIYESVSEPMRSIKNEEGRNRDGSNGRIVSGNRIADERRAIRQSKR